MITTEGCYQSVKDKKFESNSQHPDHQLSCCCAVISLSKIKNLKAIHNYLPLSSSFPPAVISLSKIKNLKAIHNLIFTPLAISIAVISLSKIKNLKAIHNVRSHFLRDFRCCYQSVKDKKFESNSQLMTTKEMQR